MMQKTTSVFISHSKCDADWAKTIFDFLKNEGFEAFLSSESIIPGSDFTKAISEALEKADVFVTLVTNNFNQSPACQQEVGFAVAKKITIIPLLKEALPEFLISNIQGIKENYCHQLKKTLVTRNFIPKEERPDLLLARDPASEIKFYDKLIKYNSENSEAFFRRGAAKIVSGHYDEAIKDFDAAIKLNPQFTNAYNLRGVAKSKLGRYADAIRDFDAAMKLDPQLAETYAIRGVAKSKLGRYADAIRDFDAAMKLDPQLANAYTFRGIAKSKLEQYTDAIKDFDTEIRLNPQLPDAYAFRGRTKNKLAEITAGQGDHALADQLRRQATADAATAEDLSKKPKPKNGNSGSG